MPDTDVECGKRDPGPIGLGDPLRQATFQISEVARAGVDALPRVEAVDNAQAPKGAQKKPEATTNIVVMGDANADWLAYGLEDAFSEKPEFGVVRKHRTMPEHLRQFVENVLF